MERVVTMQDRFDRVFLERTQAGPSKCVDDVVEDYGVKVGCTHSWMSSTFAAPDAALCSMSSLSPTVSLSSPGSAHRGARDRSRIEPLSLCENYCVVCRSTRTRRSETKGLPSQSIF